VVDAVRVELDVFTENKDAHELLGASTECLTQLRCIDPCHTDPERVLVGRQNSYAIP
jgi:hypothetical protein